MITDHNYRMYPSWNSGAFATACLDAQNARGVLVMPGAEFDVQTGSGGHLLGYWMSWSTALTGARTWGHQTAIDWVNSQNSGYSYPIVAHPHGASIFDSSPWTNWNVTGLRGLELLSFQDRVKPETVERWFSLLRSDIAPRIAGGRFTVGLGNTDAHSRLELLYDDPGGRGLNWVRTTASPITRAAIWDGIHRGTVSASGMGDFSYFLLGGAQQGGVLAVNKNTTTKVACSIWVAPAYGRFATEIQVYNRHQGLVARVNRGITTGTNSLTLPVRCASCNNYEDNLYLVRVIYSDIQGLTSDVWCNPVFLDIS